MLFTDLDMVTYYGVCPYDKIEDKKVWLQWMSRSDISGIPLAQCASKLLSSAQHYGTVRERVIDDLEGALRLYMGTEKWNQCKMYLSKEAQIRAKPSDVLQQYSLQYELDILHIWHCLQAQKPNMKWKKKSDIKPPSPRLLNAREAEQKLMITMACDILQVLEKGKVQKESLRIKRYTHMSYDALSAVQKRERVAEALFYNAAQTANLPANDTLMSIFDNTYIENMKTHWQVAQGLIIFDSGKIRKTKAKITLAQNAPKRAKKAKEYLPILYEMVYDLLLHGTHTMSVEMLTNIILDNYNMPDKHLKEVREECIKSITKVRKLLMEM